MNKLKNFMCNALRMHDFNSMAIPTTVSAEDSISDLEQQLPAA